MFKFVNLLIFLSVFILGETTNLDCYGAPGSCPPIVFPCEIPLPLRHEDTPPCECDINCKSSYKCCPISCQSHKICLPVKTVIIINDNALENNVKDSPVDKIDDNIKKIFKQVQDSVTTDKERTQLSNYLVNNVQGHYGNSPVQEVKINLNYNIIKNIYIQNLNIYKDGSKSVEEFNKMNNKENVETNTSDNTWSLTKDEDQGCRDDEDCQIEGSGYNSKAHQPLNSKTTDGSGSGSDSGSGSVITDDEDLFYHSGSGDSGINNFIEHSSQIELTKVPIKFKTLDETHNLYFDDEMLEESMGQIMKRKVEEIEIE